MIITLYNFTKRINSTKQPSGGEQVDVKLKDGTSNLTPAFYLSNINNAWNYLKYNDRFYYITSITTVRNSYYLIECSIDVLATYKQDIQATSAYVKYSASSFNKYIPDTRIPSGTANTIQYASAQMFPASEADGTYILTYVTKNPTYGGAGCLWLNEPQCGVLADIMSSTDFADAIEILKKNFLSVYDSVLTCKFFPGNIRQYGQGGKTLTLGTYDTVITAQVPQKMLRFTKTIDIPNIYDDYRRLSPYQRMLLFLPGYGFVELDPIDFVNNTSITVQMFLDGVTGDVTYIVDNMIRVSCNMCTDVPIGTISKPGALNAIGGIAASIGAAVFQQYALATGAAFGALIQGSQTSLGSTGGPGGAGGGLASLSGYDPGTIVLVVINNGSATDPASVASTIGRPTNEVKNLGSLTGYVETVNASVNTGASNELKEMINNYLDGGVYLE